MPDKCHATLLCMTKKWIVALLAATALLPAGLAQKDVHALQKALKGKQLVLRTYAATPSANYVWNNGSLIAEPVTVFTFGVFTVKSVKQWGDRLIFKGTRATMVLNTKSNARELQSQTPMTLELDLQDADPSTVIPKLQDMMFFPDVDAALVGLPPQIAGTLHISSPSQTSCKCKWILDGGKWSRVDDPSPRFVLPKLTYSVEPEFTKEARRKKVAGAVLMYATVSETGYVGHIWLASSFGHGMDEAAEKAAEQYVFKPAIYNDKPAGVLLGLEVNFQIY